MNPWDLSCRPKLPTDARQSPFYSASQSLTSNSSSSGSTNSSQSSSPASSRSNSIAASDEIRLGCGMPLGANSDHKPTTPSPPTSTNGRNQQQASAGASSDNHLLLADRKARKKDQNRRAAYNYRRKKMEEKNRMREEEMRLVYSRVCLIGYADELESSIMYILNTRTNKILDETGCALSYLCPVCMQSCDSLVNLRSHLNIVHFS